MKKTVIYLGYTEKVCPEKLGHIFSGLTTEERISEIEWQPVSEHILECFLDIPEAVKLGEQAIVPSLSIATKQEWRFQFFFEAIFNGRAGFDKRRLQASSGQELFPEKQESDFDGLEAQIDALAVKRPIQKWARVYARIWVEDPYEFINSPAVFSVSCLSTLDFPDESQTQDFLVDFRPIGLGVPVLSQMDQSSDIRDFTCSPNCVAMILKFFQDQKSKRENGEISVLEVVRRCYHQPTDLWGVWPCNIAAASHWGLLGGVFHFTHWVQVWGLVKKGLPVVASIRFKKGELEGAPISATPGHLVVIRGFTAEHVVVNDPRAERVQEVIRSYDYGELARAWFGGSAVGYVLFPGQRVIG